MTRIKLSNRMIEVDMDMSGYTKYEIEEDNINNIKEYVITYLSINSNLIKTALVNEKTESQAIRDFKEIYRHSNIKILSIAETGRA